MMVAALLEPCKGEIDGACQLELSSPRMPTCMVIASNHLLGALGDKARMASVLPKIA
jgi:hypothetical protein